MPRAASLELWAGAECTINRLGETWHDQSAKTGFTVRAGDLDRLASLGAKRVRLPVLWEKTEAAGDETQDWQWPDHALRRVRELGMSAILGLLHHGSGPRRTDLLDPCFADRLGRYARRVAERYPDQDAWTPVNEPVTTARFSGLYGLWYPHRSNDRDFVRMLLNQIHGTVAAMRAIRTVIPAAELIQTDDVGHTRCTPGLQHQADFDNERRWLGFDLLCGRVEPRHPLWNYLVDNGAAPRELHALVDAPCPPDIVGINAYVTSERFLDQRLHLYPDELHGGNGIDRYVDVETARAHGEPIHGFAGRLAEVWARYGLPIAITEVHLGCTREEQLRWMQQAWQAARQAREDGVDVRAVTAWAAFGATDWDSLLTLDQRHYEPGLWDVRSDTPRLTALGQLASDLGHGREPDHPVLAGAGWWQRDMRLQVPAHGELRSEPVSGSPLLITGAPGALALAFVRMCRMRGLPFEMMTRSDMDVDDGGSLDCAFQRHQPWAVIDAAGFTRADDAESAASRGRDGTQGAEVLARACHARGVRLLGFSSDRVFGGARRVPYVESNAVNPLDACGRAHVRAERLFADLAPRALVIRTSALFCPWDGGNFAMSGIAMLQRDEPWYVADDQVVSPTYMPDLVQAALDLLIDGEQGLWHLTNETAVSWRDFALRIAETGRLSQRGIVPFQPPASGEHVRGPSYSAMRSNRGRLLPTLDDALRRFHIEQERFSDDETDVAIERRPDASFENIT